MNIVNPQPRHPDGLVQLSSAFAQEHEWARTIPIGSIDSEETARDKLFGEAVVVALAAETDHGDLAGYAGVYRNDANIAISLLIGTPYRRQGLGKILVEEIFRRLPSGLSVEAWVGDFNEASLKAMPKLGFRKARAIDHAGHLVRVFVRRS